MNEIAWITTAISVVMAIVTAISLTRANVEKRISQTMSKRLDVLENIMTDHRTRLAAHDTILAVWTEHNINIEKKIDEVKALLKEHMERSDMK